ncbi:hypothetical protein SISNIDRAFT_466337 [Sistotremastrum niveocremeum HHB9708]|uniref:LIM zinc-binding domain-containing protein n=1 Tax=Sistotremastrum niveocremeum HHB9708 TaxID=1314777 RepID=A0A164U5G8_9AGAM|nr:hypothetical protein SISNIDRAFT_466337 [Sistotremastrum niveocremeum HHB9708]
MGFCRRCGDIVAEERCGKCGGASVAPVVQWVQGKPSTPDRWSQTYVHKPKVLVPQNTGLVRERVQKVGQLTPSPIKEQRPRFPRPLSNFPASRDYSSHIFATTQTRPASPTKGPVASTSADILPSPDSESLSKVYGTVLQDPEKLARYRCGECSLEFLPDATIYPDPSNQTNSTRFLCRDCYIHNGGSKGACASCQKPVLTLASEGGFIKNANNYWHKQCFRLEIHIAQKCGSSDRNRCNGCRKLMADSPVVDLLGRPSCAECFDTCLQRPTSAKGSPSVQSKGRNTPPVTKSPASKTGSPLIEELSQKLGLIQLDRNARSTGTPGSPLSRDTPKRSEITTEVQTPSPKYRRFSTQSPRSSPRFSDSRKFTLSPISGSPNQKYGEEVNQSPLPKFDLGRVAKSPLRASTSNKEDEDDVFSDKWPMTPDLVSDCSTSTRCPSPESSARMSPLPDTFLDNRETTPKGPEIFGHSRGAKSVDVQQLTSLQVRGLSQGVFDTDPKTTDAQDDFTPWIRDSNTDRLPRWGKSGCCPECNMSVSPMERGVVPGPGGTRWHASCLICGGKGTKPSRNKSDKPGCGKKLDSAARMDSYRRAWCQECLIRLPPDVRGSPQRSPVRERVVPMHTGGTFITRTPSRRDAPAITAQWTGASIPRQITGNTLVQQLTGGGLSPTRQLSISPTKRHGADHVFRRPKSVLGTRGSKSVDEGRGMFLVRQVTGNGLEYTGIDHDR